MLLLYSTYIHPSTDVCGTALVLESNLACLALRKASEARLACSGRLAGTWEAQPQVGMSHYYYTPALVLIPVPQVLFKLLFLWSSD